MPVPGSFWNHVSGWFGLHRQHPTLFTYLHGMMLSRSSRSAWALFRPRSLAAISRSAKKKRSRSHLRWFKIGVPFWTHILFAVDILSGFKLWNGPQFRGKYLGKAWQAIRWNAGSKCWDNISLSVLSSPVTIHVHLVSRCTNMLRWTGSKDARFPLKPSESTLVLRGSIKSLPRKNLRQKWHLGRYLQSQAAAAPGNSSCPCQICSWLWITWKKTWFSHSKFRW